ncbi:MAG: sulfatase [Verrucomicrobia bacterium]|nr:sulfatase [Verrucomicrobiota bacterium]
MLLTVVLGSFCLSALHAADKAEQKKPNFIIINCDNVGYGDFACFGSKKHRTPRIDKMAAEGMRLTSFYATAAVCTPSRASLMTGCYPRRVNLHVDHNNGVVLFPISPKGLNPDEVTIAEVLKKQDYATICIGKWHLGDQLEFLPTRQGFDEYFGIPYSDNMVGNKGSGWPPLPLMRNEKVVDAPTDRNTLTKRYTEEAIDFIERNKDDPFFIYLPHAMPGSDEAPFASEDFLGKSANGRYGDSIEEIDWSTGEILDTLKRLNIDRQTLVILTSDNGAYLHTGGGNLPLRGGLYDTYEGGFRIPTIAWWPGRIKAGVSNDEVSSMMDLLPTFAGLAGQQLDGNRVIDGKDIWPILAGKEGAKSPHEAFYYYFMTQLHAVRSGKWKLHLPLQKKLIRPGVYKLGELALYDLDSDIGEKNNIAADHPNVVKRLKLLAERARRDLGDEGREGSGQRPAATVEKPTARVR